MTHVSRVPFLPLVRRGCAVGLAYGCLAGVLTAQGSVAPRALGQTGTVMTTPGASATQNTVADTVDTGGAVSLEASGVTASGYLAAYDLLRDSVHGLHLVTQGRMVLRRDSVKTLVDSMARRWLAALATRPTPLSQQLPMAALYARVGQDAQALAGIATVLAQPHLSGCDRAWILRNAVGFLLGTEEPPTLARIQIARDYVTQLEQIPQSATDPTMLREHFTVLSDLMRAEARVGHVAQGIDAGRRAYALVAHAPDDDTRRWMGSSGALQQYALLLSWQPTGRATIDSLLAGLAPLFVLPPPVSPNVSIDAYLERQDRIVTRDAFERMRQRIAFFGRPAAPFVATHWFNQPTPTTPAPASVEAPEARVQALDDGVIRIISVGFFGCPWCHRMMGQFQRMQSTLPKGVALAYYVYTEGAWGGDLVTPDEEAEHLRHAYVDRKHYTFPIAVWAGPKAATPDGGMLPQRSPMLAAYDIRSYPTIFVVDGHGMIRYYDMGYESYDVAATLAPVLEQLLQEREHHPASAGTH